MAAAARVVATAAAAATEAAAARVRAKSLRHGFPPLKMIRSAEEDAEQVRPTCAPTHTQVSHSAGRAGAGVRQADQRGAPTHGRRLPGTGSRRRKPSMCAGIRAHASRAGSSVFLHRVAAAGQRHTRKQPARQGVQWVGRRVQSGIDISTQKARHRRSIIIGGRLCRNGPCEAPTSRMSIEDASDAHQASARSGSGQWAGRAEAFANARASERCAAEAERSRSAPGRHCVSAARFECRGLGDFKRWPPRKHAGS